MLRLLDANVRVPAVETLAREHETTRVHRVTRERGDKLGGGRSFDGASNKDPALRNESRDLTDICVADPAVTESEKRLGAP